MTREQIEQLAYDILTLYDEFKQHKDEYVNIEELSYLLGFEVMSAPLAEKGVLGLLGKNIDDNIEFSDFIAVDNRLGVEGFREVVSDLLMQYLIEDFEDEKEQYRIMTEIGSAEYLELVLPKEKFLEKHIDFVKTNGGVPDNVIYNMSIYFNVSKEAINRRYESLEMMSIKEDEFDKKIDSITKTLKMN